MTDQAIHPAVSIYTTETCHWCKEAKKFFTEHQVAYQEFDVGRDLEKRKEMVERSGQMGVPVIAIGDVITVGFNKAKLAELLGIPA